MLGAKGRSLYLENYTNQGQHFLKCYVTQDKTWVNYTTTKPKKASMMWKQPSRPAAKKLKAMPSVRKIMATVFWNHKGVLLVDFLDHGDIVTDECHYGTKRLCQAIHHNRPGWLCQGVINTGHHTYNQTCAWLLFYSWDIMDHLSYSPNLAPSDSHLFKLLKKHLASKQFVTDDDVKQAVTSQLQTLDINFFSAGI
jgi:histone-lysine N-methyltransferase SETMAR